MKDLDVFADYTREDLYDTINDLSREIEALRRAAPVQPAGLREALDRAENWIDTARRIALGKDKGEETPGETLAEVNERRGWPREEKRRRCKGCGNLIHPIDIRESNKTPGYLGHIYADGTECGPVVEESGSAEKPGGVGEYTRKPEDA